jgi:hypothetical protein
MTGSSYNNFTYADSEANSYYRLVDAKNNTITKDQQGGSLKWDFWPLATVPSGSDGIGSGPGVADGLEPLIPFRSPRKDLLQG